MESGNKRGSIKSCLCLGIVAIEWEVGAWLQLLTLTILHLRASVSVGDTLCLVIGYGPINRIGLRRDVCSNILKDVSSQLLETSTGSIVWNFAATLLLVRNEQEQKPQLHYEYIEQELLTPASGQHTKMESHTGPQSPFNPFALLLLRTLATSAANHLDDLCEYFECISGTDVNHQPYIWRQYMFYGLYWLQRRGVVHGMITYHGSQFWNRLKWHGALHICTRSFWSHF